MIPSPIVGSIWLANGSLLVGAGHQMCLFGHPRKDETSANTPPETLFEQVARQNGPLEDYHPQMLLQCLLWGVYSILCFVDINSPWDADKVELVKEIIVNLARDIEDAEKENKIWQDIPIESFLRKDQTIKMVGDMYDLSGRRMTYHLARQNGAHKKQYTSLFSDPEQKDE